MARPGPVPGRKESCCMVATAAAPETTGATQAGPTLQIEGLRVAIADREIIHGVDLRVDKGEVHAILGPNGSGKSTLAYALMGDPRYDVTGGTVTFKGQDLL